MLPTLGAILVGSGLFWAVFRLRARADERVRSTMIRAGDLDRPNDDPPHLSSLDHLEPPADPEDHAGSPYRIDAASDDATRERHARAHTALTTAGWLLGSAASEAEDAAEADRLGRSRRADTHRREQTRCEIEALQCVFEAEDLLRTRILREPGEPRHYARFYGRAAELRERVDTFTRRAFPDT